MGSSLWEVHTHAWCVLMGGLGRGMTSGVLSYPLAEVGVVLKPNQNGAVPPRRAVVLRFQRQARCPAVKGGEPIINGLETWGINLIRVAETATGPPSAQGRVERNNNGYFAWLQPQKTESRAAGNLTAGWMATDCMGKQTTHVSIDSTLRMDDRVAPHVGAHHPKRETLEYRLSLQESSNAEPHH